MNFVTLLGNVPWALLAGWLLANVIPYLSAVATRTPSWSTGLVTMGLSLLDGILSEVARGHFDWRSTLGVSFVAWAVASLQHAKVLKGTPLEAQLHAIGSHRGTTPPRTPMTGATGGTITAPPPAAA